MNVLFITSSRIGDAVLSTGLLSHIIHEFPQARVTIACAPLVTSLFEGVPNLAQIIPLKKQKHHKHWLELWKQVIGTKWDMVVDLRDSAVSRLVRAKKRYVFGKHIDKSMHKVQQNAAVMKLDTENPPAPHLWFSDEQIERANAIIEPNNDKIVGVGPTANWIGKTWPPENFIEIVQYLTGPGAAFENSRVAVFAAPGEEENAREVLASIPQQKQIDVIAKTDPGTAAACLSLCDFYIGNDSGLMHCAAAAGVPTFGVFGPSYPHIYAPWGEHSDYARTPETFDELTDFAGYDPKTLTRTLMGSLTVEAVREKIDGFIERLKSRTVA